ncbi:M48 family metalloprotease [Fulvivirgaceae bacterium BMA12]|uniref:M48 family metalloprotease n=1 Tax=Agaribacillus aureus TaxID=3051825 RepID=A0ABT8LBX1_9BACT|nr:M48 family metalloprotease [Fulvivirgaceae bacterium BMA12]
MKTKSFMASAVGAVILLLINACAVNPVTGKRDLMLISEERELAMGKESDPGVISYFGLYDDQKLQDFINTKGKEMAAISHRSHLDFKFRILDSPVINAFAVPGGYVYFTRGILAHFNNEAEFAGVLGHEIGHVTARHSARQQSKQMIYQGLYTVGMVASKEFRTFSDVASQSLGLLFLKFSREHETESDRLGVEYSTRVGYDAKEMANFFGTLDRMRKQSGAEPVPDFLSTHPNPVDRFQNVGRLASEWKTKLNATNLKVNRNQYLNMIDGLVFGEDPRQGFFENDVFYHPVLKFQFPVPTQWKTVNTPQQVQLAPDNGKAAIMFSLAQEKTLQEALAAVIKLDSIKVIEKKEVKVNGLPAMTMVADQSTTIRFLTYLIQHGKYIYKFHGISSQQDYSSYAPVFVNTMKNFKPLTDPAKLNVKPDRVRVVSVKSNSTAEQAFKSYKVKKDMMETTALLNSMKLTDKVNKGSLIKIVRK